MGLPLAAQFADHGWNVVAVDIDERVVASINEGRSHIGEEPGVGDLVQRAHDAGRLRATTDGAEAAGGADVVVLIVPVMLDARHRPDHGWMDSAVDSIAPGIHAGSLVIFETTLPVGDTRERYGPRLVAASGLPATGGVTERINVAFSPERLYSGAALANLATYPKLVGGLDDASTALAAAFYESVLDAEVVAMSSAEAAEFSKLADTTVPRREHRAGQRIRLDTPTGSGSTSPRSSTPRTASRTATSTSRGSGWAVIASRSTRTSCWTGPPSCRSSRAHAK
jgi:nucleotide sugar dehydrogenase